MRTQGSMGRTQRTDTNGGFTFESVSGNVHVEVHVEDDGRAGPAATAKVHLTPEGHAWIDLDVPADRPQDFVTGRVSDTLGRPVSGAHLQADPIMEPSGWICGRRLNSAITKADGSYRLRVPVSTKEGEAFLVSVSHGFFHDERRDARGGFRDFDFRLPATSPVAFRIYDRATEPPIRVETVEWRPARSPTFRSNRVFQTGPVLRLQLPPGVHEVVLQPESEALAPLRFQQVVVLLDKLLTYQAAFEPGCELSLEFLDHRGKRRGPTESVGLIPEAKLSILRSRHIPMQHLGGMERGLLPPGSGHVTVRGLAAGRFVLRSASGELHFRPAEITLPRSPNEPVAVHWWRPSPP